MGRVLLTAPFIGEIGWELMSWQARVRHIFTQGGYDRLVVLGGAGKAAFYEGVPLEYRPVDLSYLPGAAYEDRRVVTASGESVPADLLRQCVGPMVEDAAAELAARGEQVDTLFPAYAGKLWPCDGQHQRFIRYERSVADRPKQPWVVLVERTRAYYRGKNWPASHWSDLAAALNERGVHTTVYPCEAEAAITMLSACDLAVGQSTGGLHLASLCGCPTLVWSVQRYLMWPWEITNRQRYETWWNPLGSPVVFHDLAELPSPEAAAEQVMAALQAVGRTTGSRLRQTAFACKYSLRQAINRWIIEPRRYVRWPWSLQQFVRYQLA